MVDHGDFDGNAVPDGAQLLEPLGSLQRGFLDAAKERDRGVPRRVRLVSAVLSGWVNAILASPRPPLGLMA